MTANAAAYVTLRAGLTIPLDACLFGLGLEARGIALAADRDHRLLAPADPRLTDDDLARLHRWRHHVPALVEYRAPELVQ